MKKWKQLILSALLVLGVGATTLLSTNNASAITVFSQCSGSSSSSICAAKGDSAGSMIKIVINTALTILGMIAVLMIVIGGIRYTTSNGNSTQIKEAKDTILYSIVGLVVAIMSYAIVNFVVSQFK
jgi:Type IV secretion system pilin